MNFCGGIFDWDVALSRLDELNALTADPELWAKPEKAQAIMREKNRLEQQINSVRSVETALRDNIELLEMAEAEKDDAIAAEAEKALKAVEKESQKMQLLSLLSGEADGNDAYLEVNSGAGGTESCDWAQMLLRMYTRWAEQHDYKVSILDRTEGDEAGIKSCTIRIEGDQAYGWLKSESGVHRLVRISPFDSAARRHTSFASVSVSPVIDENIEIEILDKDLRTDTYRSSGAGGTARQQDGLCRAHHPYPDRDRGCVSDGTLAAPEPRPCDGDAESKIVRTRTEKNAKRSPERSTITKPISAGVTRSALTFSNRTK